jgi:hypothetical protein
MSETNDPKLEGPVSTGADPEKPPESSLLLVCAGVYGGKLISDIKFSDIAEFSCDSS